MVAQKENERASCCHLANIFKVCSFYSAAVLLAISVGGDVKLPPKISHSLFNGKMAVIIIMINYLFHLAAIAINHSLLIHLSDSRASC